MIHRMMRFDSEVNGTESDVSYNSDTDQHDATSQRRRDPQNMLDKITSHGKNIGRCGRAIEICSSAFPLSAKTPDIDGDSIVKRMASGRAAQVTWNDLKNKRN